MVTFGSQIETGFAVAPDAEDVDVLALHPSVIRVKTLHHLRDLLFQVSEYLGEDPQDSAVYRQNVVDHETQHADAARKIGAPVLGFGVALCFSGSAEDTVPFTTHAPIRGGNLALKHAVVALHPLQPSDADILEAADYGYDIEKVGREASQLRERGIIIPAPLSYVPSSRSIIDLGWTAQYLYA